MAAGLARLGCLSGLLLAAAAVAGGAPAVDILAMNQTIKGETRAGDPSLPSGRHFHPYRFHATAGQTIRLTLVSPADAYSTLRPAGVDQDLATDDDSGPGMFDATLTYRIPQTADYDALVSSGGADDLIAYTLTLTSSDSLRFRAQEKALQKTVFICLMMDADCSPPQVASIAAKLKPTPIAVGQTVRGVLGPGDTKISSTYLEGYAFAGQKNQRVAISLESSEFDPFLMLIRNGKDRIALNDDVGGGLDSRLEVTLPTQGQYLIVVQANGDDGRHTGAYSLSLSPNSRPATGQETRRVDPSWVELSWDETSPPKTYHRTPIAYGRSASGELVSSDPRLFREQDRFDTFVFAGKTGDAVRIAVQADRFKPLIDLYTPNGVLVFRMSEDHGVLTAVLDQDGVYRFDVRGESPSSRGDYEVTVARQD